MSAIIGLEEHMATPAVLDAWREAPELMSNVMMQWTVNGALADSLQDVGDERLRAMDAAGVEIAVLSVSSPGLQAMPAGGRPAAARQRCDRRRRAPIAISPAGVRDSRNARPGRRSS